MSETAQILLGLIFLIGVYILTRYGVVWRMKRAVVFVIKDLERNGAFDPSTGVELPYAKSHFFNIGMRDFKPKALQSLIQDGIVGQTDTGRYYLKKRPQDLSL